MTDAITLTNSERMELMRRANSRTDRAEDARRARLILLLAEGHTWDEITERIECSRGFVASWSKRFAEQRIAGLYGRPVTTSPDKFALSGFRGPLAIFRGPRPCTSRQRSSSRSPARPRAVGAPYLV
jgi:hypothetical protein